MKKRLFMATVASGLLLCGTANADNKKMPLAPDSHTIIGYAYLKNGNSLVEVSLTLHSVPDDTEVVLITKEGFYPNYSVPTHNDDNSGNCGTLGTNPMFCKSAFSERTARDVATSTLLNVFLAPIASAIHKEATYADDKTFNTDKFLTVLNKVVSEEDLNKLLLISNQQAELEDIAKQKSQEIDTLYTKALADYKDNISLISLSYSVNDKSGLLQNKELNGGYSIALNAPAKKSYTYTPLIQAETFTKEDALSKIANLKEKIDQQYQKDLKEYKTYLSTAFKNYKIVGQSEKNFSHNSNISFNATIKAPTEVPYTLGKKININIPITIESASLNKMVPKTYALDDSNFIAVMGANSDLSVNAVLSNKTQSFITVKSLTCYYQNLVNNIPNLDKELAPESRDLDDGTRYTLLSSSMKDKSNFSQMTKSKADSIKINYGYAVKYKVNDTNIEKALYTTKNYSLYDIYRQYL